MRPAITIEQRELLTAAATLAQVEHTLNLSWLDLGSAWPMLRRKRVALELAALGLLERTSPVLRLSPAGWAFLRMQPPPAPEPRQPDAQEPCQAVEPEPLAPVTLTPPVAAPKPPKTPRPAPKPRVSKVKLIIRALGLGRGTARDIAAAAGCDLPLVSNTLQRLQKRGIAERHRTNPITWSLAAGGVA